MASLLLSHPQYGHYVDCNATDSQGNSALHLAVKDGRTELFALLTHIAHGTHGRGMDNPRRNAANACGDSPLLLACLRADRNMVETLLSQGGDKQQCNAEGLSPNAYVDNQGPPWLEHLFNSDAKAARVIQACYRMRLPWLDRSRRLEQGTGAMLDEQARRNFNEIARVQALVKGSGPLPLRDPTLCHRGSRRSMPSYA